MQHKIIAIICKCQWLALAFVFYLLQARAEGFSFETPQPQLHLIAGFETAESKVNTSVKLIIYGQLEKGWHLYSVKSNPRLRIIPTSIVYQNMWYQQQSQLEESKPEVIFDQALGVELQAHRNQFRLAQTLLISKDAPLGKLDLVGFVQYQVCNQKICLQLQQKQFIAPMRVVASE